MIAATTEALLGVLKWVLLALLYLFFARVLWAVWSEVRAAPTNFRAFPGDADRSMPPVAAGPTDPTVVAPSPLNGPALAPKPTYVPQPVQVPAALQPPAAAEELPPLDPTQPAHSPMSKRIPKGRRGVVGRLVVIEPRARRGTAFAVDNEITVGRAPTNVVTITDDTYASQLHARIYRNGASVIIDDLGSTNGTFVNGRRVSSATELAVGDRLQIGSTIFEAQ